ncbi:MAG: pyridoxal-phosphate dependent enzyme [Candidatus Shapirobacteria bacterium]|nr:pyridoxal-phosphate dependent enzyme [Candidatus Shapirobacteria bacterium]MDD4410591.1 pyridoxal-phosphate dependent enzyme [Candidatus Shapirobacteria bacterium]
MENISLKCDFCQQQFGYPYTQNEHRHPEYEIGGVPINLLTMRYDLTDIGPIVQGNYDIEYRKMLPYRDKIISQNEGHTPLLKINLPDSTGNFFIKDESTNPTGSFKDRGISQLVTEIKSLGKKKGAIPSTGNAGISFVSYSNIADIEPIVFLPETTSSEKLKLVKDNATLVFDKDLIKSFEHFFEFCRENPDIYNGFPSTNNTYLQGLKTTAYEIYSQLGQVPDWVFLPCGSGGNIVGCYQGFLDLLKIGLTDHLPRFVSVQCEGADPITYGHKNKILNHVPILENPTQSKAEAIASDTCFNYFRIQNILQLTHGTAVSVSDKEIENIQGFDNFEFSSRSVIPAVTKINHLIKSDDIVTLIGTAKNRELNL